MVTFLLLILFIVINLFTLERAWFEFSKWWVHLWPSPCNNKAWEHLLHSCFSNNCFLECEVLVRSQGTFCPMRGAMWVVNGELLGMATWDCKDHLEEQKGISVLGLSVALAFLFSSQPGGHPHRVLLWDFFLLLFIYFSEAIRQF